MLALLATCVNRVIFHLSALVKAHAANPLNNPDSDPVLLLRTANLKAANESSMGILMFVPPPGEFEDVDDDLDDMSEEYAEKSWTRRSVWDNVYY
jgi:hypothetical protein